MPQDPSARVGGKNLLSLAMIVRDGGEGLRRCLASVSGLVDEMVVVDTGSGDGSRQVAAAAGALVLDYAWEDDFAAARNVSLAACSGRWILVLDADEALSPQDLPVLREWVLAADARGDLAGAVIPTRNYLPLEPGLRGWRAVPDPDPHALPEGPPAAGFVITRKVRIMPNHPDVRFAGCLHEMVDRNLVAAGGRLAELDVPVHHFGTLDQGPGKRERYLQLALRKTERDPENAQAWGELAECWQQAGDSLRALDAIDQALKLEPANPSHRLRAGLILLEQECWREAEHHVQAVTVSPLASDAELAEALHARAIIGIREGRLEEAGRDLKLALRLDPEPGLYWNSLGVWHMLRREGEAALAALERARRRLPGHPDPLLNLGILHEAAGDAVKAVGFLEAAVSADPGCAKAHRHLERLRAAQPSG